MGDPPGELLLTLRRVRVQFGTLVAVRDVALDLRGGDLLGLIGPNGAGKTTLLRAICGLQPLTCGTVEVFGQRVTAGAVGPKRHVGFSPDTPFLYEELTVRDFLRFIAKGYHLPPSEIEEKIDFWLEQVWLTEKADQKIKALSRGMRQRICIARTLLPNPPVVLLDEPAAGLDPAGRVHFRRLLCSLRDQGKALIVSSHILADLNEYCTHIAIMAHGSFVQCGTVAEVAGSGDGQRCRYTLVLARPMPGLQELFERFTGVEGIELNRDHVTFTYHQQREQAAALLARLIEQRVPVASFSPNTPDLEEAYLRTGIRQVD